MKKPKEEMNVKTENINEESLSLNDHLKRKNIILMNNFGMIQNVGNENIVEQLFGKVLFNIKNDSY
jgi:hypothetical protein